MTRNLTNLLLIMALMLAVGERSVSASCADQVTYNVRANNDTSTVALYGAWWYSVQASPTQSSTDFDTTNHIIYLHFVQIDSGTIEIYDQNPNAGGQLCQTIPWQTPQVVVFLPFLVN